MRGPGLLSFFLQERDDATTRPRRLPPTVDWALYATPASSWPRPTLTNRLRARITMPVKFSTARTGPFFDPEERLAVLHEMARKSRPTFVHARKGPIRGRISLHG